MTYTLRVARPTDHLKRISQMYQEGLDLDVIGTFEDHDGFDGVILGKAGSPYHLEFIHCRGEIHGKAPTQDNLIVFYMPDKADWQIAHHRMIKAGFINVQSFNPYWDVNGRTYKDIDGYRVVLQNAEWDG
jgi:hypothetical protein